MSRDTQQWEVAAHVVDRGELYWRDCPFVINLELILYTKAGNTLIHVLENLETLLEVESKVVVDAVLGTHTNVGAKAVYAITNLGIDSRIRETGQWIDGKMGTGANEIVEVQIEIKRIDVVALEVVNKLGLNTHVVDELILEIQPQAHH